MFDAGATVREKAENAAAAQGFLSILKSKQKDSIVLKLDVKIYDKAG